MNEKPNILKRVTGFLIYLAGIVLALGLLALLVLPDFEANTFAATNYAFKGDERLTSLRCPALMTRDETAIISIRVDNPTDREVDPTVLARMTMGNLTFVHEIREKVVVPAGESRIVEWEVDRKDAAYDQILLGRFYQMRNSSLPSRLSTCGVYVLPFSGPSGVQVLIAAILASLALTASGIVLMLPKDRRTILRSNNAESRQQRARMQALAFLGVFLIAAILLALLGNWLLSSVLAILAATATVTVLSYALIRQ